MEVDLRSSDVKFIEVEIKLIFSFFASFFDLSICRCHWNKKGNKEKLGRKEDGYFLLAGAWCLVVIHSWM